MDVKKYELYMGKYDDLVEEFSFVKEKYEGKKTTYFDMPSEGIKKQFKSLLEERLNMGAITYCKVIKHRKDPLVEVITKFVYVEDVFAKADEGYGTSCNNRTRCGNTAPVSITPEELFGDGKEL